MAGGSLSIHPSNHHHHNPVWKWSVRLVMWINVVLHESIKCIKWLGKRGPANGRAAVSTIRNPSLNSFIWLWWCCVAGKWFEHETTRFTQRNLIHIKNQIENRITMHLPFSAHFSFSLCRIYIYIYIYYMDLLWRRCTGHSSCGGGTPFGVPGTSRGSPCARQWW